MASQVIAGMQSSNSSSSTFNAAVAGKRKQRDVAKLMMSDYKVTQSASNKSDMVVEFVGPADSFYEGGVWKVHVQLPEQYPYKSPSIGFLNKIFHPNVDEASGSVCLDVINQTWSPMFELVNIFDNFLPQLLNYPNPSDPLNSEAASLMNKNIKRYETKVREYVKKYASGGSIDQSPTLTAVAVSHSSSIGATTSSSMSSHPLVDKEHVLEKRISASSTSSRRESQEMEEESQSLRLTSENSMQQQMDNFDSVLERKKDGTCSGEYDDDEFDEQDDQLSSISIEDLSELSDNADLDIETITCFA